MTIDEALEQIEDISRSENPYEYGLPTHDEDSMNKIKMVIKQYAEQKLNIQLIELTRKHQDEIREVRNKAYNDGYSQGFKHGVYRI